MPQLNLKNGRPEQALKTDVCIAGAGVAGSVLALELAEAGRKVVLLESGGAASDAATQALYDIDCTGLPLRENFTSRVRELGGSCNRWTGRAMRFRPFDFAEGKPDELHRWPISLEELSPYYERAGRYFNLPHPPKFEPAYWRKKLSLFERRLYESPHLAPTVSLWAKEDARFGQGSATHRKIDSHPNITVVLWANLQDIILHDNLQTAKKVTAVSLNQKQLSVEAKLFVLACGGLETPRILLNADRQISSGIGNQSGMVGRCFMDHPKFEQGRLELRRPTSLPHLVGRPIWNGRVRFGLSLHPSVQRQEALLNPHLTLSPNFKAALAGKSLATPANGTEDQPKNKPNTTTEEVLKHYARHKLLPPKITSYTIYNYLEQPPQPESRVYLDRERDALGQRKLILHWTVDERAFHSLERLHHYINQRLEQIDMGRIEGAFNASEAGRLKDASHHMGTTRMGGHPEEGVVDRNCLVFGTDNLYIAGSAVFPTSGNANPTFTIAVLSLRLADHLNQQT